MSGNLDITLSLEDRRAGLQTWRGRASISHSKPLRFGGFAREVVLPKLPNPTLRGFRFSAKTGNTRDRPAY